MKISKREIEKKKKCRGEGYISKKGTPRLGKTMLDPCPKHCRQLCQKRVTEQQRQAVFDEFYALGDTNLQWEYIAQRLDRIYSKSRRKKGQNPRSLNIAYNFLIDGKLIQVCKTMFKHTLNIGDGVSLTALKKCKNGVLIEPDKRGGKKENIALNRPINQFVVQEQITESEVKDNITDNVASELFDESMCV